MACSWRAGGRAGSPTPRAVRTRGYPVDAGGWAHNQGGLAFTSIPLPATFSNSRLGFHDLRGNGQFALVNPMVPAACRVVAGALVADGVGGYTASPSPALTWQVADIDGDGDRDAIRRCTWVPAACGSATSRSRASSSGRRSRPRLASVCDRVDHAPMQMFHELTQIDDAGRLFLSGSIEDWQPVHERGVTVVVDLEGDVDHGVPTAADAFLYVYLPIHDGDLPNLDRLHAVGRLGAELVGRGHALLSHCGMGLNRSALVAALILMHQGMTGPQAVERLRARRPGALFNEVFANYLLTLPRARL
jgi:hypothetical protein